MMAAILNSTVVGLRKLHSIILTQLDDGNHLEFWPSWIRPPYLLPLKLTQKHSAQDWFPPFAQKRLHSHFPSHHLPKKYFTHSFWLNLMMAAILNSGHVGFRHLVVSSQIHSKTLSLHSGLWFKLIAQKRLKLIHSHSTWWWQPSWIWPSWIRPPYLFLSNSLTLARIGSHHLHKKDYTHISLPTMLPIKNTLLIHSDSTWWWQPSWILPCWIQTPCFLFSDSLKNTLTPLWLLTQTNSIWLKLIHSHSTWWWQPSWILPSWIWPSWIQPP